MRRAGLSVVCLALAANACAVLNPMPRDECGAPLEPIELEAHVAILGGEEVALDAPTWGLEQRAETLENALVKPRPGVCSQLVFSGRRAASIPDDRDEVFFIVQQYRSVAAAERAFERSAFWIKHADVWDSPDDLEWYETAAGYRYECHFNDDSGACGLWEGFVQVDEIVYRISASEGGWSLVEVEALFEAFVADTEDGLMRNA